MEIARTAEALIALKLVKAAHAHTQVPGKLLFHSRVQFIAKEHRLGLQMSSLGPEVSTKKAFFTPVREQSYFPLDQALGAEGEARRRQRSPTCLR